VSKPVFALSGKAALGALVAANGALVALRHDDHQIHVAVLTGLASGVRAEQINFLRPKFRHQSLRGSLEQIFEGHFHGLFLSQCRAN